jgi:serine protease
MSGIAILRLLLAARDVDARVTGLDSNTLRFVVEFDRVVDIALVRSQVAALLGVDVGVFQFFPLFTGSAARPEPSAVDGRVEYGEFYVLQFPGLERTVDNRTLFTMGHELAEGLDAFTVEPDLGTQIFLEPVDPDLTPEGVAKDAVVGTCFVGGAAPSDRVWALDRAGVLSAWATHHARGAGIRIGQPDTGTTPHLELSDIDIRDGFNVFDDSSNPMDPLGGNGNPGHGTSTASVAASGVTGHVRGPAPAATLMPIRCIESVILTFNGAAVAKAIDHARAHGANVITMSLGGTPSRAMKSAIGRAIGAGIIVLAAAGNCVRLVVYPARYDDVIAVAGSNAGDGPWQGSCRGSSVDITAPAENVWRAIAGSSGDEVGGGQGTSFAVALTAGVAALWLSHHGTQTIKSAAAARTITVQEFFRGLLVATARTPANWDADDFGAGIVDAQALLARSLADPLPIRPEHGSGVARSDTIGLLAEAWGAADAARLRDVATNPRFQLELSAVALEDVRVGANLPGGAESSLTRQGISPQLAAAIGPSTPTATPRRPTWRVDVGVTRDPVVLVTTPTGGLEAAAARSPETAREALAADPDAPLGMVEERLARVREALAGTERGERLGPLHDQLLRDSKRVLKRLRKGGAVPDDPGAQIGLEALVQLEGRPSLRLGDNGVDPDDPELGQWAGAIILHPALRKVQRSVGRIDTTTGVHAGTGFVIGDGLVMTNRHVLEILGFPSPRRFRPSAWVLDGYPTINFSPSGDDPSRSFRIREVLFSGPDPTDMVDLAHLDLAILCVEPVNEEGATLPSPLNLSGKPATEGAKLFVIGYPAMPTTLPSDKAGKRRMDVVLRLGEIYGMTFGVRYLSPGLVMQTPDQLRPDAADPWVFTHDATSLGGNSGSCVLSFDHQLDVAGLHFAGDWLRSNYAHAIDKVRDQIAAVMP